MPRNPGNNTVTFVYQGVPNDRLHKAQSAAPTSFTQPGCMMLPVTVHDKIDSTYYSQATDKCICPGNVNTLTVMAEWFIQFNGQNWRVLGRKPWYDRWGRLDHITFMCKEEKPT